MNLGLLLRLDKGGTNPSHDHEKRVGSSLRALPLGAVGCVARAAAVGCCPYAAGKRDAAWHPERDADHEFLGRHIPHQVHLRSGEAGLRQPEGRSARPLCKGMRPRLHQPP